MAVIDGIIPTANFERIRDRLGEILAVEYANQAQLTSNNELNPAVYIERFIFIDKTEPPLVNISFINGSFDNKDARSRTVDGNYTYAVDIYVSAKSREASSGDTAATLKLHRLIAITRAIIESPKYITLGYSRPFNCSIGVSGVEISDPINNNDATHQIQGRIMVNVRVPETVELIENAPLISTHLSQVKLYNTDKGYRYIWSSLASFAVTAGDSFTVPYEYSGMTVELVSDGTQSYNSNGFTQSGDEISMTNGVVFVNGQIITVTLRINDYTATITVQASGDSITLPTVYEGKTMQLLFDGAQTYTATDFNQDGLDIEMTNGVVFAEGQLITIWYGLQLIEVAAPAGNQFTLTAQYRNFEQVLVFDGTQSYNNTQFNDPEVITTMTNGVEFTEGQQLIIAVR